MSVRQQTAGILVVLLLLGAAGGLGWLAVSGYLQGRAAVAQDAQQDAPVKPKLRVSTSEDGERVITVGEAERDLTGIASEPARPAPYQPRLRASATVMDITGLIQLAGGLAGMRAQLLAAQARLAASRANATRTLALFRAQQNASQAEMQVADAAFHADEAALAVVQAQMQTQEDLAVQDWGSVLGRALVGGMPPATRLLAHQDVLLQVTLPPAAALDPPEVAMLGSGPWQAEETPIHLLSAAARMDPRAPGQSLLYVAAAQGGLLPGASLLALLPQGPPLQGTLVPAGAIVWWQDQAWAYLHPSATTYVRHQVDTSLPAPDAPGGFVVRDLAADAEVVTEGAQLLLSEEFRAQIEVGEDQE